LSTVFYEVLLGKLELYEGENELADRFERLWEFSNSVATVQHDLFTHFQTDEGRVKATGMCLESITGFCKWWLAQAPAEQQNKHGQELLQILRVKPARNGSAEGTLETGDPFPVIDLGLLRMTVGIEGRPEHDVIMMGEAWISCGTYARPPFRAEGMVMTAEMSAGDVLLVFQSLPVTSKVTLEVCIHAPMFEIVSDAHQRSKQRTRDASEKAAPAPESCT
jgi:hypothetical protein